MALLFVREMDSAGLASADCQALRWLTCHPLHFLLVLPSPWPKVNATPRVRVCAERLRVSVFGAISEKLPRCYLETRRETPLSLVHLAAITWTRLFMRDRSHTTKVVRHACSSLSCAQNEFLSSALSISLSHACAH